MAWTDVEHGHCVKRIEKLVVQTHQSHHEETTGANVDVRLRGAESDKIRAAELSEMKLLVEAVKAKDAIGVVSLCTAFFQNKGALARQKLLLEKLVPQPWEVAGALSALSGLQPPTLPPIPGMASFANRSEQQALADGSDDCTDIERNKALIESGSFVDLAAMTADLQARVREYSALLPGADGKGGLKPSSAEAEALEDTDRARFQGIVNSVNDRLADNRGRVEDIKTRIAALRDEAAGGGGGGVGSFLVGGGGEQSFTRSAAMEKMPVLVDGSAPWQLIRVANHVAQPGDTLAEIAEEFGVPRTSIFFANTGGAVVGNEDADMTFTIATPLVIQITTPITGLTDACDSTEQRLKLLEETQLPAMTERIAAAKEALWATEVSALATPLREDLQAQEARANLAQLQHQQERLRHAAEQCRKSLAALHSADFASLSHIIEGQMAETLDGMSGVDRVVYTCKEIDPDTSVKKFAETMGVPEAELLVFHDRDAKRTFAYIPTTVPRISSAEADEAIRREIRDHKEKYPTFPPRTDLLEELAALRAGDCAALCSIINGLRGNQKALHWDQEIARLKGQVANLQAASNESETQLAARDDRLDEQEQIYQEAMEELRKTHRRVAELQDELSTAATERSNAEARERALVAKNEVAVNAVRQEVDVERKAKLAAEEKAVTLEKQQNLDAKKAGELESRARALHEERIAAVEKSAKEAREKLQSVTEELTAQVEGQHAVTAAVKVDLANAIADLEAARSHAAEQLRDAKQTHVRAEEALQMEISKLNSELRHGNAAHETLTRELSSVSQQLLQEQGETSRLRDKLETSEAAIETLRTELQRDKDEHSNVLIDIQAKLDVAEKELEEAKAATAAATGATYTSPTASTSSPLATMAKPPLVTAAPRSLESSIADSASPASSPLRRQASTIGEQLTELRAALRDEQSKTGRLEAEIAALQAQLKAAEDLSRRVVYVSREIPSGKAVDLLAREVGVSPEELLPFFDSTTNTNHAYVPTLVPKASVLEEDAGLTEAVAEAKAEDATMVAPARLLEQRSALRSGDCAALSMMVTEYYQESRKLRKKVNALRAASAGEGYPTGTLGVDAEGDVLFSSDGDDDDEWFNVQLARKKIGLLQDELKKSKKREANWKRMCDEYRDQGKIHDAHLALEEAKSDFEKKTKAQESLLQAAREQLAAAQLAASDAETKLATETANNASQRRRLTEERERMVAELKGQIESERERHKEMLKRIAAEREADRDRIAELEDILRELDDDDD